MARPKVSEETKQKMAELRDSATPVAKPLASENIGTTTPVVDTLGQIYDLMVAKRIMELKKRKQDVEEKIKEKEEEDKLNELLINSLKPPKKKPAKKEEKPKKEKKGLFSKIVTGAKVVGGAAIVAASVFETKKAAEEEAKAEPVKPEEPKATPVTPSKPAAEPAPTTAEKLPSGRGTFSSKEEFNKVMLPYAQKASQKLGGKIPPEGILAQWATESDGGKSVSAPFNYAGIKAGKNDKKGDYVLTEEMYTDAQIKQAQSSGESLERVLGPDDTITKKGKKVTIDQWYGAGSMAKASSQGKKWVQVKSYFARFDSIDEFVDRYVGFLSSPRYSKAREQTTAASFGLEVAKAGYATTSADKYGASIATYASNIGSTSPIPSSGGVQLASASQTNKDMKEQLQKDKSTQVASVNKTLNVSQSQTAQASSSDFNDKSPYELKGAIV